MKVNLTRHAQERLETRLFISKFEPLEKMLEQGYWYASKDSTIPETWYVYIDGIMFVLGNDKTYDKSIITVYPTTLSVLGLHKRAKKMNPPEEIELIRSTFHPNKTVSMGSAR